MAPLPRRLRSAHHPAQVDILAESYTAHRVGLRLTVTGRVHCGGEHQDGSILSTYIKRHHRRSQSEAGAVSTIDTRSIVSTFVTKHKDPDGIYLPLQGPAGVRPKAPAVGSWQSPGYHGLDRMEAAVAHRLNNDEWFGLRCDGLVVIDCDNRDAALHWCSIDTEWDQTWVRKTPRGFHFIYAQVTDGPDAPAAGVFEHIDIRAGRTSQIVYFAPGYKDLKPSDTLSLFNPAWLPESYGVQIDRSDDESWDEIPDGRGNNTMAAFAGAFRKQGMSPTKIASCLAAINRLCMTEDPMPIEMIVEIAKSVSRYAPRPDIDIEVEE